MTESLLRILVALLICGGFARGQDLPRRPFRESVTLATDPEAARTLLTLEDRWAAGQWAAALEALIDLTETRGRSLVQADPGEAGGVARYVQVQMACDRLLAALPPEGLAEYRRRVEPRARRLWDAWNESGDVAALERLVEQLFFSSLGDRAAWELGQIAWQRGELATASSYWKMVLPAENAEQAANRYPDSSIPAADVAARLILCDIMQGQFAAAKAALEVYREQYPDATGMIAGREGLWVELLAAELRAAAEWTPLQHEDDIPTFAGSPDRNYRSPQAMDLGSELWTVSLSSTRLPPVPRVSLYPASPPVAYHPAVVDDIVYLNDGQRIFAWRLDTGHPAWGRLPNATGQIFPAVEVEPPLEPRRPVSGSPSWTVTVHGGRLYARMGSAVTTPSPLELRDQRTELVCLDIAQGEGRLLWSKTGDDLTRPDDEEAPPWSWEGTPVLDNGRLYAVLSRRRPQLAWSVACLDAETGLVLWQQPVGISRPTPPDNENLATSVLLTLGDGRLFLSTDWGAIAAVNAADGRLLWAVSYESEPLTIAAGRPAPRWVGPPCLLSDGLLFAAPLDTDHVFCLDAATGVLRWRVRSPDRVRHLLGTAFGRVIVSGDGLWALDRNTGDMAWSMRPTEPELSGYGRGWLAGDAVYWPSREAISVVDQRTGQMLREQPLANPAVRRMGGNVVVTGGVLLLAASDRLTAFGEYARIEESQQQRLSQRPDDDRARRRLADMATRRGEHRRARELLAALAPQPPAIIDVPRRTPAITRRNPPIAEPEPVARDDASGYWRRSWRRDLQPDRERVRIPEGTPSAMEQAMVLVESDRLAACDRRTGAIRWTVPLDRPVVWAAYDHDRLLWATATELVASRCHNGTTMYRVPWRAELNREPVPTSSRSPSILRTDDVVVIFDGLQGALACDAATGTVLWRHRFARPMDSSTMSAGPEIAAFHPVGIGRAEWRSLDTGRLLAREETATASWRRPPVWSRDNSLVVLTEAESLAARTPSGEPRWQTSLANPTHAAPWVFEHSGKWFVIVEGLTLIALDDRGRREWTATIARVPLTDPVRQVGVSEGSVIAAAGGECRCVDLDDGHEIWSRPVLAAGPQRIVIVNARHALVVPESPQETPAVDCVSLSSGQTTQRISLSGPARRVVGMGDKSGLLLATESAVLALTPEPATRVAVDR